MRKYRKYIVFYDDGHDFGELVFYSDYRANSRNNLWDARKALIKAYGEKRGWNLRITNTQRDIRD